MKAHNKAVCETAACDWFVADTPYFKAYCKRKHSPVFCNAAKTSPNYEAHKTKRQAKWFA